MMSDASLFERAVEQIEEFLARCQADSLSCLIEVAVAKVVAFHAAVLFLKTTHSGRYGSGLKSNQ
jgi:hypothetical protein